MDEFGPLFRHEALGRGLGGAGQVVVLIDGEAGRFIGSGVVEAGCQTVIGGRCKQSGMFWSKSGAENILAWRRLDRSRRLEDFWKYRLNQHAACNHTLLLAA